jgi:hypothetical protein
MARKLVAALGVAVGLITGLGTLVGWAASADFGAAIRVAGLAAGIAYIGLACVAATWDIVITLQGRASSEWDWSGEAIPILTAVVGIFVIAT